MGNLFERIAREFQIDTDVLMGVDEFVNIDNETECTEILDDGAIMALVADEDDEEDAEIADNAANDAISEPLHSSRDARQALHTLMRYMEGNDLSTEQDITAVHRLNTRLQSMLSAGSSQTKITAFLKPAIEIANTISIWHVF